MSTTNKFKRIYLPGASSSDVPIGTIIWYTGNDIDTTTIGNKLPGWMICDGSTISKSDYPELASIITSSSGKFKYNKIVGFKLNITRLTKGVESIVFSNATPKQYDDISTPPRASAENYNSYYIPYSTSEYPCFVRVFSNEDVSSSENLIIDSSSGNPIIYKYASDSERPIRVTNIGSIDYSDENTEYYVLKKINDSSEGTTKYRKVSIADTVHTGVYMFSNTTTSSMASELFENNSVIRDDFEGISLSDFLTNIPEENSGSITYAYNEKYLGYRTKNIDFNYNYESEFAYYKIDIEPIIEYSVGDSNELDTSYSYFGTYVSDSEEKSYIDSLISTWNNANNTEFNNKKPNTIDDKPTFSLPNLMDGTYICGYTNNGDDDNEFKLGGILEDSLPNITGYFTPGGQGNPESSGAFYRGLETTSTNADSNNSQPRRMMFDASKSSKVYGRNKNLKDRVIPKSFVAIPLIKVF